MLDPNVAIVFGSLLCALIVSLLYASWYQTMKRNTPKRGAKSDLANSVGLGELEAVMRRAVEEAVAPLEDRIASLESEVRAVLGTESEERPQSLTPRKEELRIASPDAERERVPAARSGPVS